MPLVGQQESDEKSTACEREAINHDGETAPPPLSPRKKKTPASTDTAGAQGNNQWPDNDLAGRGQPEWKNNSTVDAKPKQSSGGRLCYGALNDTVLQKRDELSKMIKPESTREDSVGKKGNCLLAIHDSETTFEILMTSIANVVCCADLILREQCACYDRLKKLIQIGIGESFRLHFSLGTRPLLYEIRLENKSNIVVDTPSFLVDRELAMFEEGSGIENPNHFQDLMHQFLTNISQETFTKIKNNKSWTPKLEELAELKYLSASFFTERRHPGKTDSKPDETEPVDHEQNKAFAQQQFFDALTEQLQLPCCICNICFRGMCEFHFNKKDFIDHGKFLTGSILRLMSRRLHSMAKISAPDSQELCHVCQRALVGEKKTVGPPSFCVACQVKTHAECRSKLYDLCAPAPALSLKDRQRNRYALHEYVNDDFKPRVPALVVHIIVLLTFSNEQRAVSNIYRCTDNNGKNFEKVRMYMKNDDWPTNLLIMNPLQLGELLKYFFSSLRPRLIGQELFIKLKKCVAHKRRPTPVALAEFERVLASEASAATRETLLFLIIHLQDIENHEELQMSTKELAEVFAPVLIDGFTIKLKHHYIEVLQKLLQVPRSTWMYLFSTHVIEEKTLL